jgi:NADH-quinone oxidoreductase subunit C
MSYSLAKCDVAAPLTDLCGIHYPDRGLPLGVVYHLHNLQENKRIRVKTYVTAGNPNVQTMTDLFETANWMERETYDFYGIIFDGHPNLKRILNVDYMDYFPLRKEYPLEDQTREDKNDKFFGR